MNHILKLACNWTPQQLPNLVRKLEVIVRGQMQEVRRAVHGQGDFMLAPQYNKFSLQDMQWKSLTEDQKSEHMKRLYDHQPKQQIQSETVVTSADGQLKVLIGQRLARKPGQIKRPRNAKTTPKFHQ